MSLPDGYLMAYCRYCERPLLVTERHWEPGLKAYLCLERVFGTEATDFVTICQVPVHIMADQDAAEAAYQLGGWPAVTAMAVEEWRGR